MRLFEIAKITYYISMPVEQNIGAILEGPQPATLDSNLEARLEAQRPSHCLPRLKSLIVNSTPPDDGFVYVIEPIGQMECHHKGWLTYLKSAPPNDGVETDRAIKGFWSGERMPGSESEYFELRVAKVRIIDSFGGGGGICVPGTRERGEKPIIYYNGRNAVPSR